MRLSASLTISFIVLTLVALGFVQRYYSMSKVYSVCNTERIQGVSGGCRDIQYQTNNEFLCEHNDNNPGTKCWVEAK